MTIPASMPAKATYLGDGVTVNFPVPFIYFENTDGTKQIKVILADENGENEVVQVENTDFTITDAGQSNGTLTMLSAPPEDYILTIAYDIPVEQLVDWEEFGRLPSESIEAAVDKITAIIKQIYEILGRCVKVTISGKQTPEELLATVYEKLDSASAIAAQAITAADNATTAANNATAAVASAEQTLENVTAYVDAAEEEIREIKAAAESEIDTKVTTAKGEIDGAISSAIEDVEAAAIAAAQEVIDSAAESATETAKANLDTYVDETVEPSLQSFVDAAQAQAGSASSSASSAAQTLSTIQTTAAQFDTNYTTKLSAFNQNATDKTTAFNSNASDKTTAFNDNAAAKQALIDTSATAAQNAASAAATSETNSANSEENAYKSELKAAAYAERVRSEGIPMSIIENKKIEISGNTVKLYWRDPRDTIIDGFVLSSWKSTTIVKKQGSEPEDIDDGDIVAIVTTRNQYANTPLEDTQANAEQWHYRAFPLSVNGVYSLDKRNIFGTVLYGYRINNVDGVPSSKVEYLPYCDNYFYDPCVMDFLGDKFNWGDWEKAFFIPKPCLLSTAGTVTYYLSKDNFNYREDGVTASDVSNSGVNGNFMCEFPSIFVKVWEEKNYINVLVSNKKLDDDFECWATKKSDGTYADNFYLPMFEGTSINNVMRSIATNGKPTGSLNAETEATHATANGTGWNTTTWADEMLMMLLFPLLFKSTDSQTVLGYGGSSSSSALTVNNNAALDKGLMYGTSAGSAYGMTYLGLHNWWGHRWRRPNGLMNDNGNYKFKLTHSTVDGSTVTGYNRSGNGYISSGVRPPEASGSYINYYQPIGKFGIVPKLTSGSSTTHYCDGMWTNNGQLDQLILGGDVSYGAFCGVFAFNVYNLPTHTSWHFGASLSYHHL
ncbi:MAG: hypothetical protein IJ532_07650 [Alphaproteobacteria bacterium]|nr:hypothetical protein [Alphaproteobacteria bacterium]